MMLRDYQIECLEAMRASKSQRQLIVLPMGCGKTFIFCHWIAQNGGVSMVVAHTIEILTQVKRTLNRLFPHLTTFIYGKEPIPPNPQIIISSIQTAHRDNHIAQLKAFNIQNLILDEAHHAAADTYRYVANELQPQNLLGFTATAFRKDQKALGTLFDEITFKRSIPDMIAAGWLAELIGLQVKTGIKISECFSKTDLDEDKLAAALATQQRNDIILRSYQEKCADRKKSLAFCLKGDHSQQLSDYFRANGLTSAYVTCKTHPTERAQIVQDFADGKIRILCNYDIFSEGFDEPSIDAILICRPFTSDSRYVQCVGRGTRKFPGKENCLLLDFTDDAGKHQKRLCHPGTLSGDETYTLPQEPEEKDEESNEKQPEEPQELIESNGNIYYRDFTSVQTVGTSTPTAKQMDFLIKLYPEKTFDFEDMTKSQAGHLISLRVNIPSDKQKSLLKKHNLWHDGLTRKQATKIIGLLLQNQDPTDARVAFNESFKKETET